MADPLATYRIDDLVPDARGVLQIPGPVEPFGYVDGAEAHLLDLIGSVDDRSSASAELPALVHDWPTEYHLSPQRWALLDALELPGSRVLEVGAGCGAVTTWLAEHFDAVDAVEGSPLRAAVTRARGAGHAGLRVVAADLQQLEPEPRYDVVTLIGVLEYARSFGRTAGQDPRDASRAMLETAGAWLAPGGALVLAIENKFGLKYLAGHAEDHTGVPYDGLEGYRAGSNAVTFTRQELEEDLALAGLVIDDLVLPFPDYKLPETLVNTGVPVRGASEWIGAPWVERATGRYPAAFDEALVLREAEKGGLLADLANSFLVVARRAADARGPRLDWSVKHYALARQPALRKRKTLLEVDGQPVVRVERLSPASPPSPSWVALGWTHVVEDEAYVPGESLATHALAGPAHEAPAAAAELLSGHAEWLVRHYGDPGAPVAPRTPLDPAAYDAHVFNVVVDPSGARRPIDLEWRAPAPVPLVDAVWRSALLLLQRWADRIAPGDHRPHAELAGVLTAAALRIEPSEVDADHGMRVEELFQWAVRGRDATNTSPLGRLAERLGEESALVVQVTAQRDDAVRRSAADGGALRAAEARVGRLEEELRDQERRHAADARAQAEALGAERDEAEAHAQRAAAELDDLQSTRVMRLARTWWRIRRAPPRS